MDLSKGELDYIINEIIQKPTAGPKPLQQDEILRYLFDSKADQCIPYKDIAHHLWNKKLVKKKGKETATNFIARITVNLHEQVRDINKKIFNSEFRYRAHIVTKTSKGFALLTDKGKIIGILKSLEETGKLVYPKDVLEELKSSPHIEETIKASPAPLVWSEINLKNIAKNIHVIKTKIGKDKLILGDMLSNALGLGIDKIAEAAIKNGLNAISVNNLQDAVLVRRINPRIPILFLGEFLDIYIPEILNNNIIPSFSRWAEIEKFSAAVSLLRKNVPICIKASLLERYALSFDFAQHPFLIPEWLFVRTPWEDDYLRGFSPPREFRELLNAVKKTKIAFKWKCASDINGLLSDRNFFNMASVCPSLYGIGDLENLEPVFALKSVLGSVYKLPTEKGISYGKKYVAKPTSIIGIIPVGFKHGYSSLLSHRAEVIIRGKPAMTIGLIGMNTTKIDISHLPDVKAGEEVLLIGKSGNEEITLQEVSQITGLSVYEFLSLLNNNTLVHKTYT